LITKDFVNLVVQSLEAITKQYAEPYRDFLYERILCYEFYHQFRSRMVDSCSFVLHGELEKGYRNIEEVPDFVFHVPRTDKHNLVTMEFKSTNNSIKEINDDIEKLVDFRNGPLFYQLGVFVLFGPKDKLIEKFNMLEKPCKGHNIELLAIAYEIHSRKVFEIKSL
jgi:hypothetical protein